MTGKALAADILDAVRDPYRLGPTATTTPLGNGHINRTFQVKDKERCLVVQQINTAVFPEPHVLVNNANEVATHLQSAGSPVRVARHLPDNEGRYLHGAGQDIRVLEFIPGSRSIEVIESPAQAKLAAQAFAAFSRGLSDLDVTRLKTVIPDFHSPRTRFRQFQQALQSDGAGRVRECRPEIERALGFEPRTRRWQVLADSLPLRICHNDCKINNVLFDGEGASTLAVIDLDTCMPGRLMTDFGDLVRSCASPEAEDSTRLGRVTARPGIVAALLDGYLEGMGESLTVTERDSLLPGAMMVCFIQGLRFLTDFIAGDTYFGAAHPQHNLERARNQFQLYDSLVNQQDKLAQLINRKTTKDPNPTW